MDKEKLLKEIKGKLIVSCQALEGEPLYIENSSIMPLMARAAKQAGAAAIRTNGVRDVIGIKEETNLPIIGIIKKGYEGYEQYITVTMDEIDQLVQAGADIIAMDCTLRERVDGRSVSEFIQAIKEKYPQIILMADISNLEEGINAWKSGIELIEDLAKNIDIPIIAEGRIHRPEQATKALDLGAHAVVVGGAITRPLEIATRFVDAISKR